MAETALTVIEVRHALWQWGHLRLMEQIILTCLTAKQIKFGLWFPRFWLMLKIIVLPLTAAWMVALLQLCTPQSAFLKLLMLVAMLLGTFSLLLGSIATAVASVAGSATVGREAVGCLFWIFWFVPAM